MQRWLCVTRPETWLYQDLAVGARVVWNCHVDTRAGDVALLYRTEIMDFSHLFTTESEARPERELAAKWAGRAKLDWWCDSVVSVELRKPITLAAVRASPLLSAWAAAQVNFHGSVFRIEPNGWRALLALPAPLDRMALRKAGGA